MFSSCSETHTKKQYSCLTVKIENPDSYCHPTNNFKVSSGLSSCKENICMHTLQNALQSHTMAMISQVLSCYFLAVEVYIQSQGYQCGICDGQSSPRAGFSPRLQFYLDNHNSIIAPYSSIVMLPPIHKMYIRHTWGQSTRRLLSFTLILIL